MSLITEIHACRACGSTDIPVALDLGDFALSDFLDAPNAHSDRAPLVLVRCQDCTLVQLRHTVDRERLYGAYWYRSGTNPTMVSALRNVLSDAVGRVVLHPGDAVLDIGANDGTLLRLYEDVCQDLPLIRAAYEPAGTFRKELVGSGGFSSISGISLLGRYFPTVVQGQPIGADPGYKIVTSIACFYDVDDPGQFVEGVKRSLAPDGVWINQLAYLPKTLQTNNFGDIVHEHLTYWTVTSFNNLIRQHGLVLLNWSFNDVNGGSVRFIVGHDTGQEDLATAWADTFGMIALRKFGQRIRLQRSEVRDFLHRAKRDGRRVIGYGASTKANTYLQYWGIGPDLLEAIADRNPDKHGKYTPTGQLVISEERARERHPDYFLILPFHFLAAFVEREYAFLQNGGQFVVPFPEMHLIGGDADASGLAADTETARRPIQAA